MPDDTQHPGRIAFPKLLTDMGLMGKGAEIGVLNGEHALIILNNWAGELLYAVDPFCEPVSMRDGVEVRPYNLTEKLWRRIRNRAMGKLAAFRPRVKYLEMPSVLAAKEIEDHALDWVYLDGCHHYEGIMDDIQSWLPKIRKGGVMAGHDYSGHDPSNAKKNRIEVKIAVDQFFGDIVKSYDSGMIKSWYVLF